MSSRDGRWGAGRLDGRWQYDTESRPSVQCGDVRCFPIGFMYGLGGWVIRHSSAHRCVRQARQEGGFGGDFLRNAPSAGRAGG